LRYFPSLVIGIMLLLVAINLAQISGKLIAGTPGSANFGNTDNLLLALITIVSTVLFARLLKGMCRQLAILLGLIVGALSAALMGDISLSGVGSGPLLALPSPFPFGPPNFDLIAALPLLLFTLISMVEATGQTIALNEVLGKEDEAEQQAQVPNTIRGDGLASLLGGIFGTSLIITSGENIGIIRATQVRSRYVTAVGGLFLILFGVFSPLSALISVIPASVIGATGLVVFAIVGTMGIDMLRKVDLRGHAAMYVVATALAVGLLPIVVPGIYDQLPSQLRLLLSNGVAMGALTAAVLNYLFIHVGQRSPKTAPLQHS
jgi:xanthine/uracil permease